MLHRDSLDKIVANYFSSVCAEPFDYKGKHYEPMQLRISPMLFRGFVCPPACGACCLRFSLDFLPSKYEPHPYKLTKRTVEFNGQEFTLYTDQQDDHNNHHCRNLDGNARCSIHGKHPFSCDFELVRFLRAAKDSSRDYNTLTQKLYGRSWNMTQVDGTKGIKCYMTPPTKEAAEDVARKLIRLRTWCDYFQLKHKLDKMIDWAKSAPHLEQLVV